MSIHTIVINHEEQKLGEFHFDDFRHLNVVETFYCGAGDMVRELEKKLKEAIRDKEDFYVQLMTAENERDELKSCLSEAIDLMEDVRSGDYKPDYFTTQPWKRVLESEQS